MGPVYSCISDIHRDMTFHNNSNSDFDEFASYYILTCISVLIFFFNCLIIVHFLHLTCFYSVRLWLLQKSPLIDYYRVNFGSSVMVWVNIGVYNIYSLLGRRISTEWALSICFICPWPKVCPKSIHSFMETERCPHRWWQKYSLRFSVDANNVCLRLGVSLNCGVYCAVVGDSRGHSAGALSGSAGRRCWPVPVFVCCR